MARRRHGGEGRRVGGAATVSRRAAPMQIAVCSVCLDFHPEARRVGATTGRRLAPPGKGTRMSPAGRSHEGEVASAISNAVVQALVRTTGRGPPRARTTLGDNGVFVVLEDTLTRGEQTLADAG